MSVDVVTNNHFEEKTFDVLDDASTVVNVSLLKKGEQLTGNKRKYESDDDELTSITTYSEIGSLANQSELDDEILVTPLAHEIKVAGWLESSLAESHENSDNLEEVLEWFITNSWKSGNDKPYSDRKYRVNVFLLDVEPSPEIEPLDLVSGYCYGGCKTFTLYSAVRWCQQDGSNVPLCPECWKTGIEKELKLLFKFKLLVLGQSGLHSEIYACKENAEQFLGCSVKDFILKHSVREAAVYPLTRFTVANTMQDEWTPLFDIGLICIKGIYFLVDTSPMQFEEPLNEPDLVSYLTTIQNIQVSRV